MMMLLIDLLAFLLPNSHVHCVSWKIVFLYVVTNAVFFWFCLTMCSMGSISNLLTLNYCALSQRRCGRDKLCLIHSHYALPFIFFIFLVIHLHRTLAAICLYVVRHWLVSKPRLNFGVYIMSYQWCYFLNQLCWNLSKISTWFDL